MATKQERVKSLTAFLTAKDFKYSLQENDRVLMGFNLDNTDSIDIIIDFDDDGDSVHFVALGIARVPENKIANVLLALNQTNMNYRWVKWFVNDNRNIMADCDAVIEDQTVNDECLEIVLRLVNIVDAVYPDLMKAIYA